jgi:hypothetical protein
MKIRAREDTDVGLVDSVKVDKGEHFAAFEQPNFSRRKCGKPLKRSEAEPRTAS